ncbi:hypothetical protein X975_11360, partial [Stegodyphus mimosarum]
MDELKQYFSIQVTTLNYFLGLQVESLKDGSLFLHQEAFTRKILERFEDTKTSHIPVKKSSLKVDYGQPNDDGMIMIKEAKLLSSEISYRLVVRSLLYLTMGTRLDIDYAVWYPKLENKDYDIQEADRSSRPTDVAETRLRELVEDQHATTRQLAAH